MCDCGSETIKTFIFSFYFLIICTCMYNVHVLFYDYQEFGYFWHVSDFHHDPRYGSQPESGSADESAQQLPRDYFLGELYRLCYSQKAL